ncbi:restriction endonuclease subunit S [Acinetobacter baumannii]|uniref:restriction endonuclease subunit S n=1 Tax=Acinetobacter baumannii TaxID=470 RepID=UPI001021860C|nr:restriction endonuclease subunit S [Acinetobacter baumannii]RYL18405.1 restriction endonuclease subunit S [Acinetobacter baumannii]
MATPKLRFKEFCGDWSECFLGQISKIYDGTHQTPNYVENGVPFYSVEHVTANNFSNTKYIAEDVYQKEIKRVKLENGDILLTRIGDIGTTKLIDWDVRASFYVSLALLKINKENNSSFINQYIKATVFQRELHQRTIHVAFPKKINLGEIGFCIIKKPNLVEQTKIASFLSSVDEKIAQLTQKHELLSQYKQGMMQKLFSQQIRFKADDGSEFEEWEEKELHQIFQIKAGGDIDKDSVSQVKTSEFCYPIFANSDKNKGFYGWANKFKYKEALTVTGRGNLGIAVARNEPFYPIVRLLILLPLIKQNLKFFEEQINLLDIVSESTGVPQLTAPQLSRYKVNVPCLVEQTKIANFLSAIDQKIELVAQQIEQAKQWKKGLLQQMFV